MDIRICIHIIGPWTSMVWRSTHGKKKKKKGTKSPLPLMTTWTQTRKKKRTSMFVIRWTDITCQWKTNSGVPFSFFFPFLHDSDVVKNMTQYASHNGCSFFERHASSKKKMKNPQSQKRLCINCCTQTEILMWLCMPRPKYHGQHAPEVGTF